MSEPENLLKGEAIAVGACPKNRSCSREKAEVEYLAFHAAEYDAKNRQTLPYYEEFYEQVVSILESAGKQSVSWLDIGCGSGKMYEAARKRISIQEFVFTDLSEEMLVVARHRFRSKENRFEQMNVLELEDVNKYDVVTAMQVHHYLSREDRALAVKRCRQALKNGGMFFTFENIAPHTENGRHIFLNRWKRYQIRNGKCREEAESHIKRYGTQYFPITIEEHFELLKTSGFQTVELIWMSGMQAGFMGIKEK